MTPQQEKATEAFNQMMRKSTPLDKLTGVVPMLPAIALDYVQDECGNRTQAEQLLFEAAKNWLREQLPAVTSGPFSGPNPRWRFAGEDLIDSLNPSESVDFVALRGFRVAINNVADAGQYLLVCEIWRSWVLQAEKVFDLLDAVSVEAYEGTEQEKEQPE